MSSPIPAPSLVLLAHTADHKRRPDVSPSSARVIRRRQHARLNCGPFRRLTRRFRDSRLPPFSVTRCMRDSRQQASRRVGTDMADPSTFAAVGEVALFEAVKSLYGQAGEALKCRRERNEIKASAVEHTQAEPVSVELPPSAFKGHCISRGLISTQSRSSGRKSRDLPVAVADHTLRIDEFHQRTGLSSTQQVDNTQASDTGVTGGASNECR